MAQTDSKCKN